MRSRADKSGKVQRLQNEYWRKLPLLSKLSGAIRKKLNFRRVVGLYRRRLSQKIYALSQGKVLYGPFAGMRWLDNLGWGLSDQGVIVLGLYEQEVATCLVEAPAQYRVFVDIGAADGYYAVGMLHSRRVDRAIAFETIPECRKAIARLAVENQVQDKITILGTASDNLTQTLREHKINSPETMVLVDIEGAEFRLLSEEFFTFLSQSRIVVETHAHIYPDPEAEMSQLIQKAARTHKSTKWLPGARNPWTIKELEAFPEIDRWILCSEGRFEVQQWLCFDPLQD